MARTPYRILARALGAFALLGFSPNAFADAGGLSFWLPGAFGSLETENRPSGWSTWATFAISPAAPEPPPAATPTYHK
jgi:hypothetical protein